MSDTSAIVNLMRHAADRLAKEDPRDLVPAGSPADRWDRAGSIAVAMTYAEAILRIVAAALTEEAPPLPLGPCPTCSGPSRETVGKVCQTCGTDYSAQPGAES